MPYTYSLPNSTSFTGKGLLGYTFGPLEQKDLEVYYIEVEKGHDTFQISKKIARTYYILSGTGYFTIAERKYDVSPGMLVEVPAKVEYSYSGKMKLLAFSRPRWFHGNDTHTKWNPDVVRGGFDYVAHNGSWLTRLGRLSILGKSPINFYLKLNKRLWARFPSYFKALRPIRSYGAFLHRLARTQTRGQHVSTVFLRNRPALELIRRLVERRTGSSPLRVAILGCSTGAEAYSVAWTIRSARPDLDLTLHGVDISKEAVEIAKCGVYSLATSEFTKTVVCERMTASEIEEIFDRNGDQLTVKSWIKKGTDWRVADVGDPNLLDMFGPQDIVIANNFLCHMDDWKAEECLRNLARLVDVNGYLFVSGVDLDIRTRVARALEWSPVQELLAEIHEGDPWLTREWPFDYTGLEPLDKKRRDWTFRYAAVFHRDAVRKGLDRL